MFPKKERLSRAAFPLAASSKNRITTAHFSLSPSTVTKGYAVVVSKKVAPKSVDRHLLKRRVTAVLEKEPLPPALIVYARGGSTTLSFAQIKDELAAAFRKLA